MKNEYSKVNNEYLMNEKMNIPDKCMNKGLKLDK